MTNNEFTKLYNETQTSYMKLRNMPITKLKVWFVEAMSGMSNPVWTSRLLQIEAVSLSRVLLAHS